MGFEVPYDCAENRLFESPALRQSHDSELSLRLYGRQKKALFQRHLLKKLGTAHAD